MSNAEISPNRHPTHGDQVPRWAIWAATAVVAATILLALGARTGTLERFTVATAEPVQRLAFTVADRPDGRVLLLSPDNGALIAEIATGQQNFVRGVLRGFARERQLNGMGAAGGFELVRWSDDRLSIRDLATGRLIDLGGFGIDNAGAFARLLTAAQGGAS
jgi:putative photosynthetic complex assembly protein